MTRSLRNTAKLLQSALLLVIPVFLFLADAQAPTGASRAAREADRLRGAIAFSFGTKALIMGLKPASLHAVNAPDWWPISAGIALGGALLGAACPGLKAARQDAIEALSYQ